uniref:RNA pseudouridylate synthase, group 1 n=1 Tax=uncultured bacterium contig00004 TaxID=1181496 RepID=A0A806KMI8_9BACT|nr:RNA pseudouridylate synthase, group 1 [uncultured bacterium contig00004]
MPENNHAVPLQSRILYQSPACIVVNKLKGEAVEGAVQGMVNLPQELAAILPANTELIEAVHRLDVPVTGCALFALTSDALTFLNAAFSEENSSIAKLYWAIVEKPSRPLSESGEFTHWIETNTQKNKSFAYDKEAPGRKKAVMRYRVIGEGTNYLFVEIDLLSGRHHQIRAQFAAIGLHIKGDLKYGAKRSEKTGGIRLHARSLAFPDPLNKSEKITVTAAPPERDNLWEAFENSSHGGTETRRE